MLPWANSHRFPKGASASRDRLHVRQPSRRKLPFDQQADTHELTNPAADPVHRDLADCFNTQIAVHMAETGDDRHMHADFPPPGFLTHEAANDQPEDILLPNAVDACRDIPTHRPLDCMRSLG